MYALKLITVRKGRQVEEMHTLGKMFRLEFHRDDALKAASVEYADGNDMPSIDILCTDEAYITTLEGKTVRCISRGRVDRSARRQHKCMKHWD